MAKTIHAFVTSKSDTLQRFYDTLEVFYYRFNPDRYFNYVGLDESTSKPILHHDPDYILDATEGLITKLSPLSKGTYKNGFFDRNKYKRTINKLLKE